MNLKEQKKSVFIRFWIRATKMRLIRGNFCILVFVQSPRFFISRNASLKIFWGITKLSFKSSMFGKKNLSNFVDRNLSLDK